MQFIKIITFLGALISGWAIVHDFLGNRALCPCMSLDFFNPWGAHTDHYPTAPLSVTLGECKMDDEDRYFAEGIGADGKTMRYRCHRWGFQTATKENYGLKCFSNNYCVAAIVDIGRFFVLISFNFSPLDILTKMAFSLISYSIYWSTKAYYGHFETQQFFLVLGMAILAYELYDRPNILKNLWEYLSFDSPTEPSNDYEPNIPQPAPQPVRRAPEITPDIPALPALTLPPATTTPRKRAPSRRKSIAALKRTRTRKGTFIKNEDKS